MATHCSILAWEILWTEEPGGLQSMGLQRMDMTEATKYVAQGTLLTVTWQSEWEGSLGENDTYLCVCVCARA